MDNEEIQQIKEHVLEVVKKSGINISVTFVEKTPTNSTGSFNAEEFTIEFSINALQFEKKRQDDLGNPFPSHVHLADLIIAHELGHAKDQQVRNYLTTLQKINETIWKEANLFHKDALKKACQQYATYNYGIEEIAWDYAKTFFQLSHDKQTMDAYIRFCLGTYEKFYPYHFKMHAYALRLMEQWKKEIESFSCTFNYNVVGHGYTSYNKNKHTLEINLPQLYRTKPKDLLISPNHYFFYHCFFHIAKGMFVSNELEGRLGKLLISIRRKGYTEEDKTAIKELSEKRKKEMNDAFSYMERKLKRLSSSYVLFKDYVLKKVEEDLQDNYEYIEELIKKYESEEKAS